MGRPRTGSLVFAKSGWRARVTVEVDGEAVQRTIKLGTTNKAAARRKLTKLAAELAEGNGAGRVPSAAVETVADYAEQWFASRKARGLSVRDERGWWTHYWQPTLGALAMRGVRTGHVAEVLSQMADGELRGPTGRRLRRSSILRARAVLLAMFTDAWREETVPDNPIARATVPRLRETQKDRTILTDAELRQLLGCPEVHPELKMLVLLSRTIGGMRAGDLNALDWTDLDAPTFTACRVPRSKTGKPMELDVPEPVRPFIEAWWRASDSPKAGPVFPARRGRRAGEPKGKLSYAKRLREALLDAGVRRHECTRAPDAEPRKRGEPCCPGMAADPL